MSQVGPPSEVEGYAYYYVSWTTGDDLTGTGTLSNPFKTITHALQTASTDHTVVRVAGGANAIYKVDPGASSWETFPLTAALDDVTIEGYREPKPTISLKDAEGSFGAYSSAPAAFVVDGRTDWTFKNLRLDASEHNTNASPVRGIHVCDLPANGTITVQDCEIVDFFDGIYFEDSGSYDPEDDMRTIVIDSTAVSRCGPVSAFSPNFDDKGHAGIRLLEAQSRAMQLTVTDCVLESNHDALEPGGAVLFVSDTRFELNENGLEYASTTQASGRHGGRAQVYGCWFVDNEPLDAAEGGVPGPTGGIVARNLELLNLSVRQTDFEGNQIGASFKGGTSGNDGGIEFGTAHSGEDRGDNSFVTDTTSPWYQGQDHTVSYCGLFNSADVVIHAVGNTWTFESIPPGPDYNQGADSNGQFPSTLGSLTIGAEVNFDSGAQFPYHRALFGTTDPQQPWNYSTGPVESAPAGTPSIVLVP